MYSVQESESTLFIMPHCEASLYDAVLRANWGGALLRVAILGNSFREYADSSSHAAADRALVLESCRDGRLHEFPIVASGDHPLSAFNNLSLHLFCSRWSPESPPC